MVVANKRITEKRVEIAGRNWIVKKFDAFTGTYILYQLLNMKIPPVLSGMLQQLEIPIGVDPEAKLMSKEEFFAFQRDCLRHCFEALKGGPTCVIDPNGNFGVIDLETDLVTVLLLTFEVLRFNAESFFDENESTSEGEATSSDTPPSNA